MSRLLAPPGVPLAIAQRRLRPGYSQPTFTSDGVASASSFRARATATGGAANTKGSWTEIITATTNPVSMLYVGVTASTFTSGTNTSALLDIGIGAAASEVVIVPNLAVGWLSIPAETNRPCVYAIPVNIPVGSRVAIRCQGAQASKTVDVQLIGAQLPNGRPAPTSVVDIGSNTANSRGVSLGAAGSTNTKTAWTEITSATTQPFVALAVGVQGAGDVTQSNAFALIDIGFGAAGAEVVLAPNLPFVTNSAEHMGWYGIAPPLIPCRLPAGTRLTARYQVASTGGTLDVILYGIPK